MTDRSPRSGAPRRRTSFLTALLLGTGAALVARREAGGRRATGDGRRPALPAGSGDRGRTAQSPTQMPARGWKDVLLRVWRETSRDRLLSVAAGVTFYALLALVPAIAAFVSLYGLVADPGTAARHIDILGGVLPGGAMDIIGEQVGRIASQEGQTLGFALAGSVLVSLWSANAGMKALIDALNVVYEEDEKRSFIRLTSVSLAFTVGAMLFALVAVAAVVVVPVVLGAIGLGETTGTLVRLGRWPLLLVVVALALSVVYRYGPSRDEPRWRWVTPGSALAAVLWLVVSLLFNWYAANFASYNETYGSLGAAIAFMTWIWLSTAVVLLGGELNAELEHQTVADSTGGPERPLGERGARMADTVAERP
ncbi:YihY/virulence factor BrkB family protein [Alsobacter sp. R-9]